MISSGALIGMVLFWLASANGPSAGVERISPEVAAERGAQCGLGQITIRYDEELQENILTVTNAASANESQLTCLDKATGWYTVELPPAVQPRFDAIRQGRGSAMALAEARKWLAERGLLERVPKYVRGRTSEAVFTRKVESLCGRRARGAFQSKYGFHVLNPNWVERMKMPPTPADVEVFSCLTHVATVAGFEIGFIGNEAYSTAR